MKWKICGGLCRTFDTSVLGDTLGSSSITTLPDAVNAARASFTASISLCTSSCARSAGLAQARRIFTGLGTEMGLGALLVGM